MRPRLWGFVLTGGWLAAVEATLLYLPGADQRLLYIAGYGFSMLGPLVPAWRISRISDALWAGSGGSPAGREARLPMAVGFVEDGLYTTAYLLGKSEFIGAWLVLKVAGGWQGWTHGHDGVSGRAMSQIFLIGTGLSLAYGIMGALLIFWLGKGLTPATIAAPAALVVLHAIVWVWATIAYKPGIVRQHVTERPNGVTGGPTDDEAPVRAAAPLATYDKHSIALSQVETALRLYDEGQDLVSVITLAGAAEEIFGRLLEERGDDNSLDSLTKGASAIHRALFGGDAGAAVFARRANRAKNALKHHDPGQARAVTLNLREEATDMLDRAITNYWRLEKSLTPAMARFTDRQRNA